MQSRDYNLCKELRKTNYFQEKSEKKRNFLPKYFADTEKSRTFAVHLRNKDAYLTHRNPYITMLRSLIYLHVSVIEKWKLSFAVTIAIYSIRRFIGSIINHYQKPNKC